MPVSTHLSRLLGTQLAEALNAYQWPEGISFEAAFRRVPDYTLEDLGTLKVSVIPGPVTAKSNTRSDTLFDVAVGIVLAKHVATDEDIADLEDLNQTIIDAIRSDLVVISELPDKVDWIEIAMPVLFDRDALTERNVFMSQTEITFQVSLAKIAE